MKSLSLGAFKLRQLPPSLCALFNVPAHSDKQLRQFKCLALSTLTTLLSHRDFVVKVGKLGYIHVAEELVWYGAPMFCADGCIGCW